MSGWVTYGTCGSCANYEYEGENSKGYCSYFKSYYYPDDSCRYYEEGSGSSSGGGGCFLTTACCQYKGLADDCHELAVLRRFRDNELRNIPGGQEIVERYYRDAPAMVEQIDGQENREEIYEWIYGKLTDIVAVIEQEAYLDATLRYMLMVYDLYHYLTSGEISSRG